MPKAPTEELLRRAYYGLLREHKSVDCEYGPTIPEGKKYHEPDPLDEYDICEECDILREIEDILDEYNA